jgi:caffeoyl-CoA O-methyltransferase
MEFIDAKIEDYAGNHTSPESELLAKINRETHLEVLMPRMLSGHIQGRFLSLLSHLQGPKRILEIGTYTGYSALCMAEGMAEDGQLLTIDINEELADRVRGYFDESPWGEKMEMKVGDATEIIPATEGHFDMVFIDADKENYSTYFDLIVDRLNPGGIIIADNVLWSGKVLEEPKKDDEPTIGLIAYNKKIKEDPRVENVLLPIRDGLLICRKK